jgi:hypothetical protein
VARQTIGAHPLFSSEIVTDDRAGVFLGPAMVFESRIVAAINLAF